MIAVLVMSMIPPWQRINTFLHFFKQILLPMQIDRYHLTGLFIVLKGSFGKITRTKTLKIYPNPILETFKLAALTKQLSYSISQLKTIRGVLSLKV